jgi:hypothetical protein
MQSAVAPTLAQRAAEAVAAEGPGRIADRNAGNGMRSELPSNLPTTLPEGVPTLDVSLHYYDSASGRSFISINGLYRALKQSRRDGKTTRYCDACFTGEYPTTLSDRDSEVDNGQLSLLAM